MHADHQRTAAELSAKVPDGRRRQSFDRCLPIYNRTDADLSYFDPPIIRNFSEILAADQSLSSFTSESAFDGLSLVEVNKEIVNRYL